MKHDHFFDHTYAVSEVIGGIILVAIAFVIFAVIYANVFPLPLPAQDPNVHLVGYVNDQGKIVIEHVGGEQLASYEIYVDGERQQHDETDPWMIGEQFIPSDVQLESTDDQSRVVVYAVQDDGYKSLIFDGVLTGKNPTELPPPQGEPEGPSMAFTSLRTNSLDEDLICYTSSIQTNITPITYIFNWTIDNDPLARLIYAFDTRNTPTVKDYTGRGYNGTVLGATWTENGKLGGAYQYDGDDSITIPYCFGANTLDYVTVETWVNTNADSAAIASYNRNDYWELGISNGKPVWSTHGSDGARDTIGSTSIDDDFWHHLAATYDASTGVSQLYVDGILETTEDAHIAGVELGTGDTPVGYLGRGTTSTRQTILSTGFETQDELNNWREHNTTAGGQDITWDNLRYDTFNSGWGNYIRGGADCYRTSSYKHEGAYSALCRDNSGTASAFSLTTGIDVDTPGYASLQIDFWWMWNGLGWTAGEDWWVRYFDGATWTTVLDVDYPSTYVKDTWYHQILYINETDYVFPTGMKIRFQCDASYDTDMVYFDQIYINATTSGRQDYEFSLFDASEITPYAGSYSIGGTGDFDPDSAAYNRTGIDISQYEDVQLSVWYSYKDTEAEDFFGLYYLYNDVWIPVVEIADPIIGTGQISWTQVQLLLPSDLDILVLQCKWMTSSITEYVAIDNLEITGRPPGGENYTGIIDEFHIYPRVLSSEQIYQNYLCAFNGNCESSVIVAEETQFGEIWRCHVTPNDSYQDDIVYGSESIQIWVYPGGE